jgi:hypothetical protein
MTILQEAKQYLKQPDACVMESRIIEGLLSEIRCLKIQVCDRGNSFQKATEKNKQLRATLKEVSGCHEKHDTPKLCDGCLISIGDALAE